MRFLMTIVDAKLISVPTHRRSDHRFGLQRPSKPDTHFPHALAQPALASHVAQCLRRDAEHLGDITDA